MSNVKLKSLGSLLVLTFVTFGSAYATTPIDVDQLLKTANLSTLIGVNSVRNLIAQMSDPNAGTSQINEMSDFIALGVTEANETVVTEFDGSQQKLKQMIYGMPWIGVADFNQADLPRVSLQDGLQTAKSCLPTQGNAVSDQVARVAIYKTLNTQQVVYDYAFKYADANSNFCQEILYTPVTQQCELGRVVLCHYNVTVPRAVYSKNN